MLFNFRNNAAEVSGKRVLLFRLLERATGKTMIK